MTFRRFFMFHYMLQETIPPHFCVLQNTIHTKSYNNRILICLSHKISVSLQQTIYKQ